MYTLWFLFACLFIWSPLALRAFPPLLIVLFTTSVCLSTASACLPSPSACLFTTSARLSTRVCCLSTRVCLYFFTVCPSFYHFCSPFYPRLLVFLWNRHYLPRIFINGEDIMIYWHPWHDIHKARFVHYCPSVRKDVVAYIIIRFLWHTFCTYVWQSIYFQQPYFEIGSNII